MSVAVDQPREDDPRVVADNLSVREPPGQVLERTNGQDLAAGEGDRTVAQVTGCGHGEHVPAMHNGDGVHRTLLGIPDPVGSVNAAVATGGCRGARGRPATRPADEKE